MDTMLLVPASYALVFPPELIGMICGEVLDLSGDDERHRNVVLAALIGREWAMSSLPLLDQSINISWSATSGIALLNTLLRAQHLFLRVRQLSITFPTIDTLTDQMRVHVSSDVQFLSLVQKDWEREQYGTDREWGTDATSEGDEAKFEAWQTQRVDDEARRRVEAGPDARWLVDTEGIMQAHRTFWILTSKLANLESLSMETIGNGGLVYRGDLDNILARVRSFTCVGDWTSAAVNANFRRTLLTSTPNIRTLSLSIDQVPNFLLPTQQTPFPHITTLRVHPPSLSLPRPANGHEPHLTALILASQTTLRHLSFIQALSSAEPAAGSRYSNRLIAEALLPSLPNLLSLSLSESRTDPPSSGIPSPIENRLNLQYPPSFLLALSRSFLSQFSIGDVPSDSLLAALPPTITSLNFSSPSGCQTLWIAERLHDRLVGRLVKAKAKARLPILRHVSISFERAHRTGIAEIEEEWKKEDEDDEGDAVKDQIMREEKLLEVGVRLHSKRAGAPIKYLLA